MIVETLGGWGPAAQGFFKHLASAVALKEGLPASIATDQLYQSLGISLQRANARAILARVGTGDSITSSTLANTSTSEAALELGAGHTTS